MSQAKNKNQFVCESCGSVLGKWAGCCPHCQSWNSIVEQAASDSSPRHYSGMHSAVKKLSEITTKDIKSTSTGITEFDRVLGGGVIPGLVVLIGGDPGIGKSTLLLQALANLASDHECLYVSGEESLQQFSLRAKRLGCDKSDLSLLAETCVETIIEKASSEKLKIMIVDSIQTLYTQHITAAPGSVSQIREATAKLVQFAKLNDVTVLIVGHVTKEGQLAGPRVLEHMVDTVLYFEGEPSSRFRMIRSVKNRYGAVNELGVFAMTEKGLKAVSNPSAIFLSNDQPNTPGHAVTATWEGTRPMLIEVQALVDDSFLANPRRVGLGIDHHRLAMILAVLHKHAEIKTFDKDVYVNVVGGLKLTETAPDLGIMLAIYASLQNQVLAKGMLAFGEIGLSGEVRPVPYGQERISEAIKHGFNIILAPKANAPKQPHKSVHTVGHIGDVLAFVADKAPCVKN